MTVTGFDEFLDQALAAGTGRRADGVRQVPAFVPGGSSENSLFDSTIQSLVRSRFNLLDIRGTQGYEKALNSFSLSWPRYSDRPLADQYAVRAPDAERRLLIICGGESLPRFWKNLRVSSVLYTGAVFPPFLTLSTSCIVVPDNACVCVIAKAGDFANLPTGCTGPVCEYTSQNATWLG